MPVRDISSSELDRRRQAAIEYMKSHGMEGRALLLQKAHDQQIELRKSFRGGGGKMKPEEYFESEEAYVCENNF